MLRATITVPEPVKAPPVPEITSETPGSKVAPLLTVSVPVTAKLPVMVMVPAEAAKVKLVNDTPVAPVVVKAELESKVTVPVGLKVTEEFTVSVPKMLKLADG